MNPARLREEGRMGGVPGWGRRSSGKAVRVVQGVVGWAERGWGG